MQTIDKEVFAEIVEKKSKFISNIYSIKSSKEAEQKIEEIRKKYHDAKHHCFAYRVLEDERLIERASDDGEPSGTAGGPILNLLAKNELVNVVAIVTRYFGGILLGTGGLVRAYTQATSDGLAKAEFVIIEQGEKLKIPVSYQNLAYWQYYCRKKNISVIETNFEEEPYLIIEVTSQEKAEILHEMQEKQFSIEKMEILGKTYIKKNK